MARRPGTRRTRPSDGGGGRRRWPRPRWSSATRPYLELVADLVAGKRTVASGMRQETTRAEAAVDEATAGASVAVISTGDAGVYGMAGLVLEMLPEGSPVTVEVVPGVTAARAPPRPASARR